jgi:glucose-1-phosphate cytidylyltransferase
MKSVIFCGGYGTRMNNGEPGNLKPLIKVAGVEILRHIISIYEKYNICEFILLGGYKIEDLVNFANMYSTDLLKIKVIDTGVGTPTAGRLLLAKEEIGKGQFLLTYGDSLTNFNLYKCQEHKARLNADMIISSYNKTIEYGIFDIINEHQINKIYEKTYSVPINAGFYILDERIFPFINSLNDSFEIDILPKILNNKEIKFCVFDVSFWHPMDTPNDRNNLEKLLHNNPNILFE